MTHEPKNYNCPFCGIIDREANEINRQEHIVYEDDHTLAFVAPKWWINNPGHVLVIPKEHTENIYTISDQLLGEVYKTAKRVAVALKEVYKCDGTSMRQHNEPAGNQDVWHFHAHVFPHYANDNLYKNHENQSWHKHEEIVLFANKLKDYFKHNDQQ
jgi:histidine triad (HIT) family protein